MQKNIVSMSGGARIKQAAVDGSIAFPLVTVVVVAFMDRQEVAAIIDNVSLFRSKDLELVIIDGGSKDGTVELLQANSQRVDYWLSEPDSGIYDAMNKGIAAAHGEYILHINAGDRLRAIPWGALRQYAEAKADVVCCRVMVDGDTNFVPRIGILSKIANTWHHQGTFYRRAVHLGYDATYHTHGDFDHNQRIIKAHLRIEFDSTIVADHQSGGASMRDAKRGETYRSIKANFGGFYFVLARLFYAFLDIRSWLKNKLLSFRTQLL